MAEYTTIELAVSEGIARVTLARPDVRNAFNATVIAELHDAFSRLSAAPDVRAAVLAGQGKLFCGGADVNWMRESLDLSFDANAIDAEKMSDMFRAIDGCPFPVVARIQGGALGGGAGLAAVCDIVISTEDAVFGFTEVKLGIIPAVISPFVLAKIGTSHARALFVTGERFDAARALQIGLVHEIVNPGDLDEAVEGTLDEISSAGPSAVRAAKQLVRDVLAVSYAESRMLTAKAIARQRISPEGQEGLRAFLERRKPSFSL
jgi:methylglutaconyl-CoA hydratase